MINTMEIDTHYSSPILIFDIREHCEDSRADENKDIDAAKEADKEADTNLEKM